MGGPLIMKWYSLEERARYLRPLNFIIGGRGIGKTYSAIDWITGRGDPFIYLRNIEAQLQECSSAFGNPFKRWNADKGKDYRIITERRHSVIYDYEDPEAPRLAGYAVALSTFENMRGVDLSDVKYVLFDEFIEKRTLSFNQFETFANFYETVNRNRELLGEDPLQVYFLSNAQRLNNQILAGYGVIPIIEDMIRKNREYYYNDLLYVNLPKSEVSAAKRATVNYKLTEGTEYHREAIENIFAHDSFLNIGKQPLNEYMPVCRIDDIYIWQHKSKGIYYACRSSSNKIPEYTTRDSLTPFLRRYGLNLRLAAADGRLYWSEFLIKSKLSQILK